VLQDFQASALRRLEMENNIIDNKAELGSPSGQPTGRTSTLKRLFHVFLTTFLAATAGAAWAQSPVELKIMTSYGTNQSRGVVLQELVDQFNAEQQGKISVSIEVDPDHPAMQAKLRTMIAAGAPPDIFHYNFNSNDLGVPTSGQLLDFAPFMDEEWASRFNQGDLERFTFDGKLVSLPFQQSPAMFYYNTELFEKAGITEFPATWTDLLAACDALQKIDVSCISFFTKADAWHASNAFTYIAACLGGIEVLSGETLETPAVIEAFRMLKQLFAVSTRDAVGASYDVSSKNFLLGRTAMVIDGPWAIGGMNEQFPTAGQIKVASAPTCDNAQAPEGFIVTDAPSPMAGGIQQDPARAAAVVEWFRFFTSDAAAAKFAEQGSQPVAFRQSFDPAKVNALFASYLAASSEAPAKVISAQRVLLPAAQTAWSSILEALALDQISPEDAAAQLQAANVQ
jgi:raffinose/stachyose/melibiose transport system substrate-binding protein